MKGLCHMSYHWITLSAEQLTKNVVSKFINQFQFKYLVVIGACKTKKSKISDHIRQQRSEHRNLIKLNLFDRLHCAKNFISKLW